MILLAWNFKNEITKFLLEKKFKGVLEGNPNINQIHTVNLQKIKRTKSIKLLTMELSRIKNFGNFDLVIDFQGLIKTAIVLDMTPAHVKGVLAELDQSKIN